MFDNVIPLPTPAPPEPFLTTSQVAAHLSCSTRWVEARGAAGMPAHRFAGLRRYLLSEVLAWLREDHEVAS